MFQSANDDVEHLGGQGGAVYVTPDHPSSEQPEVPNILVGGAFDTQFRLPLSTRLARIFPSLRRSESLILGHSAFFSHCVGSVRNTEMGRS